MNHTPCDDQTVTGSANQRKVELQEAIAKMHKDLEQFEKYYNFTKTAVLESFNKFEIVLAQMSKLVAIAHGVCSDGLVKTEHSEEQNTENPKKKFKPTLPNPDISIVKEQASYSCQAGTPNEKNRTQIQVTHAYENVKMSPEISIIEEPEISLIKSPEISKIKEQSVKTCKADSSAEAFQKIRRICAVNLRMPKHVTFSQEIHPGGLFKTKDSVDAIPELFQIKEPEISLIKDPEISNMTKHQSVDIRQGGPSNEMSLPSLTLGRTSAEGQSGGLQIPHEKEGAENLYNTDNEAVIIALDKTKGVLSREDFNSYLFIGLQVEDPVQLAKISFTQDIENLYYQLLAFSFNLKNENDRLQKENLISQTNRKLEERLQKIITAFQNDQDLQHRIKVPM